MVNIENLKKMLENVNDPDLGLTLGELGAIGEISNSGRDYRINLRLVSPVIGAVDQILSDAFDIATAFDPTAEYDFKIEELIPERSPKAPLKNVKHIIAVSSGQGGVGKSAIAANIAVGLAQMGASVGMLDSDVYGPSQPTMFGIQDAVLEAVEMPDGRTVALPLEKYGVKVASMGFMMHKSEAAIIRGPMLASYFSMLFEQVDWGNLDFLIFDLPPGTGDIQLTLTQKIPLTGAVVVTTPQEIALADVRRAISMFGKVNVKILGIVENMSYFAPPESPEKRYYIFGKGGGRQIAEESGVRLLGEVPLDIEMREGNDSGKPIVLNQDGNKQAEVLREVISNILSEVRRTNFTALNAPVVEISL